VVNHHPLADLSSRKGQVMGEIHFLPHRDRKPVAVTAQRTGMLLAKRPSANVSIGDCLGIIAWDV
jgi:hypothetical protein